MIFKQGIQKKKIGLLNIIDNDEQVLSIRQTSLFQSFILEILLSIYEQIFIFFDVYINKKLSQKII